MARLTLREIDKLRDQTYRRTPELAVSSEEAAAEFINQVGFCFLFPVKGAELPNLWDAINGGHREIPHHHNDYSLNLAWTCKDTLPSKKRVFYAKLLKGRPTLISLSMLPYFCALSDNYGESEDYLDSYHQGRMSEEAKRIYEVLIAQRASTTGVLRREAGLWGWENSSRFDRALRELQTGLWIAKCGTSAANRWKYCYVYDLFTRWLPEAVERGLQISTRQAVQALIAKCLETVVATTPGGIAYLFDWSLERTAKALDSLIASGAIAEVEVTGEKDRWVSSPSCLGEG